MILPRETEYQTCDTRRGRILYLYRFTKEGKISANVFVKPTNIPDDTFLFEYSLFFISVLYDLYNALKEKNQSGKDYGFYRIDFLYQ